MQIRGKSGTVTKIVLEARYSDGYVYLDKCGRTINQILRESPQWITKSADPQTAGLVSIRNRCSFHFSSIKYDFSLERPLGGDPLNKKDLDEFFDQVASLCSIVHDQLGLKVFTRLGCRVWYFFDADSKENAQKWLLDLRIWQLSPSFAKAFNSEIDSASMAIVMTGSDRMYRIGLNTVERSAQIDLGSEILSLKASALSKNQNRVLLEQLQAKKRLKASPGFAVMIDVDAYQEDPVSVDAQDFAKTSVSLIEQQLAHGLAGAEKQE